MKVFVSYSRRDANDFAETLRDHLISEYGMDVFTDVKNIEAGDMWSNIIEENIKTSDLFIIIITRSSLRSPEVEKEVLLAKEKNKKIIPCIYKGVNLKDVRWDLNKIHGPIFENKDDLIRKLEIFQREKIDSDKTNLPPVQDSRVDTVSNNDKVTSKNKNVFPDILIGKKFQRPTLKSIIPIIIVVFVIGFAYLSYSLFFINPQHTMQINNKTSENPSLDTSILIGEGENLINNGNYTGAIQYLDRALEIDPNYESALFNKGVALVNLRDYTGALSYLDRALEINPSNKYTLNSKGISLRNLGNNTGAIQYLDRALEIDPNYESALNNKGVALLNLHNYTEALDYFDRALEIDPNFKQALNNKREALFDSLRDNQTKK